MKLIERVEDSVRVIIDSRDASKDRRLPRTKAIELYNKGLLHKVSCYSGRLDFASDKDLPDYPRW